jgi:choline dehydrogenase-like flavoprotein
LTSNWWEAGGCVASQPDAPAAMPDLHLGFAIGQLLDHGRATGWGRGFTLQARVLHPASRGRVQLASKDPFALPWVDPNLLGQREDLECLQRGLRLLRQIAGQPALAALGARESRRSAAAQADLPLETFIRDHAQASGHWTGSCRMGSGPLDVVDAQLRVHGVQGLRVVDASVLPCSMGDGTQAAVLALAEKAVDLLRADNTRP